jgi:hypothetical protein
MKRKEEDPLYDKDRVYGYCEDEFGDVNHGDFDADFLAQDLCPNSYDIDMDTGTIRSIPPPEVKNGDYIRVKVQYATLRDPPKKPMPYFYHIYYGNYKKINGQHGIVYREKGDNIEKTIKDLLDQDLGTTDHPYYGKKAMSGTFSTFYVDTTMKCNLEYLRNRQCGGRIRKKQRFYNYPKPNPNPNQNRS